ncbi:Band 4.1-like protein 5 [Trichoplax sp. H2]|nr:Band 4.1-like protein 5 [Trichoplax sp. H2]|eukprot:RDD42569.1 Band 4.1-like protein 5 [Trichoplax sp. H2]
MDCSTHWRDKSARGQEVYDAACQDLDLEEKEYFGLSYTDSAQVTHWVDPTKKIRKQVPIGPPFSMRFLVKYSIANPDELQEEVTKYLFYQHIRNEILYGRLECPTDTLTKLAGYVLQSELGDFDEEVHTEGYVSEFRFLPEMIQTEEIEAQIVDYHKLCEGQTPAEAEKNFLTIAKTIDMYGVDLHYILGDLEIGLAPNGIIILRRSIRIEFFYWPNIVNLEFKGKKFIIVAKGEGEDSSKIRNEFKLGSAKACKHLWKSAIEQHSFYRLTIPDGPVKRRFSLFRTRSSFRFSGRTLYQAQSMRKKAPRQSMNVKRTPSQRQSRRSHRSMILPQKTSPSVTTVDVSVVKKSKSEHEIDGPANVVINAPTDSKASNDDHLYTEVKIADPLPEDTTEESGPLCEEIRKHIVDSETNALQRSQSHFVMPMPCSERISLDQSLRRTHSLNDVANLQIEDESELIRTWKREKKLLESLDDGDKDAAQDLEEIKDLLSKLAKYLDVRMNSRNMYKKCSKEKELLEKIEEFKRARKQKTASVYHEGLTTTVSDSGSSYAATTEQLLQAANVDHSDDSDIETTDL